MSNFASEEYTETKKWITAKISEGASWESAKTLFTNSEYAEDTFIELRDDELLLPPDMEFDDWAKLIEYMEKNYIYISDPYGISAHKDGNTLPIPTSIVTPWVQYKKYLLGQIDGKVRIGDTSVTQIENNTHWILNHLLRDTRSSGPRKGLVMGSVQSGKTANMIGLATMAATYDWNFIIILSGTIDNLRKQTRDRFMNDLLSSGGAAWHVLEKTSDADYMKDIVDKDEKEYTCSTLELNTYQDGRSSQNWTHRYVTVCLKNSSRLRNLIKWLHTNKAKAARLRILVIDDEADQASINTKKMTASETDEELIERTAVNQLIMDLVNGKNADGTNTDAPFQAMNYICFTATPYANVLNESYESSLYPKDFICSLPESKEYFGSKVIFGSANDDKYPGLNIFREIPESEISQLKSLHDGTNISLPPEFQKSVCWFLCAAAVLRNRGHKKPISMLIHTTAIQNGQFEEYHALRGWLISGYKSGTILPLCESVYANEKDKFTKDNLAECYPDYAAIDSVDDKFPSFNDIKDDIKNLISNIVNIQMADNKTLSYTENAVHLCVDNCKANRPDEDGSYLRIVYPSSKALSTMSKAPVFIIMGGNTLARGLTIEGLVCTYFGRNSNQADTLMQMARWFGYRKGYELLQRIWMPYSVQQKFELLEEIDEKLKSEFEDFMEKGRSPQDFGPRIMSSSQIARFVVTSKNKSQNAIDCDYDFSGDSYETTKFEDDQFLQHNIDVTDNLLEKLGNAQKSKASDAAYVWYDVDFSIIQKEFFEKDKYHIYKASSLSSGIPIFLDWMKQMNQEGRYLHWNVAIAGDSKAKTSWGSGNASVGKIERSKKTQSSHGATCVDIGSLRSGADALCDIKPETLSDEQRSIFTKTYHAKKKIVSNRGRLGMEDTPLLLLYRIDKDLGKENNAGRRTKLNTSADVIGFSIIIAGEPTGKNHAHSITVRLDT